VIVVWKLDRLARSMRQLIDTMEMLKERGIALESLTEKIDTASAPFSEFEEKGLGTHPIKVRWE